MIPDRADVTRPSALGAGLASLAGPRRSLNQPPGDRATLFTPTVDAGASLLDGRRIDTISVGDDTIQRDDLDQASYVVLAEQSSSSRCLTVATDDTRLVFPHARGQRSYSDL